MVKDILILEDDPIQLNKLNNLITINYDDVRTHCYSDVNEAISSLDSDVLYNAFFLDISMSEDEITNEGMEIAGRIRSYDIYLKTPIIFITGYPQFVYDAINETHCYSYITKPYKEREVTSILNDILYGKATITIRTTDQIYINLSLNDIYYIESIGRYQHIHTISNDEIISREHSLKEYEKLLPAEFIRCHRSYIVNRNHINSVSLADKIISFTRIDDVIPFTINSKVLLPVKE